MINSPKLISVMILAVGFGACSSIRNPETVADISPKSTLAETEQLKSAAATELPMPIKQVAFKPPLIPPSTPPVPSAALLLPPVSADQPTVAKSVAADNSYLTNLRACFDSLQGASCNRNELSAEDLKRIARLGMAEQQVASARAAQIAAATQAASAALAGQETSAGEAQIEPGLDH